MKIQHINKKIGEQEILKDISLEFDSTGVVFVMGKSGAGKSTLFNIMSGIDSDYEGNICYDAKMDLMHQVEWYRRNVLGIIFQDFNLIQCLTVKENILLGIQIAGKAFSEEQYEEIISMLDIKKLEHRSISNLSGGEKQRVAIARALLRDDKIIFADEPSGSLDEENTMLLFSYIKQLAKERLFIIITHDGMIAQQFGDRIIEIKDGRVTSDQRLSQEARKPLQMSDGHRGDKENSKWMLKYSYKNFYQRRKKTIGIICVTTIALLCLLFILGFRTAIQQLFTEIDSSILENDKFIFVEKNDSNGRIPLKENTIAQLENNDNVAYFMPYYDEIVLLGTGEKEMKMHYEVIENNDFYQKRYCDIEGKLPEKSNEIMIDKILAEKILGYKKSYIGDTICLTSDSGFQKDMTVTAVRQVSSKDEGELYVVEALSRELYQSALKDCVTVVENDEYEIISSRIYQNDKDMIVGHEPTEKNEIIISANCVNYIQNLIGDSNRLFSEKEILQGEVNDQIEKGLLNKEISLYLESATTNLEKCRVVGVCRNKDEDEDEPQIYFSSLMLEEKCNNRILIFLKDISESHVSELEKMTLDCGGYLERYSDGKSQIIQGKMSLLVVGVAALTIVIVMMSAVMIHYFMKISIYEQHYEIGVLLSLGMSRKRVKWILLLEQAILSLCISCVVSLIMLVIKVFNVDTYLVVEGVAIYCFRIWHLLSVVLFSTLFTLISSYPSIISATKRNIVNLLVEK